MGDVLRRVCTLVLLLSLLLARRAAADTTANGSIASGECGPRCQAEPREALVQLYQRLNGPQWLRQWGWLSEEHHCRWYGVVCCLADGKTVTEMLEAPDSTDVELVGEPPRLRKYDVC
jgi:hypothetical protein